MDNSFEHTIYSSECQTLIQNFFGKVIERIYKAFDRAKNGLRAFGGHLNNLNGY